MVSGKCKNAQFRRMRSFAGITSTRQQQRHIRAIVQSIEFPGIPERDREAQQLLSQRPKL
jgi:hypothetical protein